LKVFKSKEFARFARKNLLPDATLCRAVEEIHAGTVDAELGGGVYKQRLRRTGEGKSGGFRTIILLRWKQIAIFAFGFAKSERANITPEELIVWRRIAKDLLTAPTAVQAAIEEGKLIEVLCNGNQIPK
jgi:hypothetical protein